MIDRFGLLPEPTKNLLRITALKLQAEQLGIKKVDGGPQGGRNRQFAAQTPVDPLTLDQVDPEPAQTLQIRRRDDVQVPGADGAPGRTL